MKRREFFSAATGAMAFATARMASAQAAQQQGPPSMTGPMDGSAYRPVKLPARNGATPQVNDEQLRTLEKGMKCQCTCPQDVYNCRTTDFTCPVSPAMHGDVVILVNNGYSAQEIIDAFVDVYGERVRMAPVAEGFNLFGYLAPYIAVLGAGTAAAAWIARSVRRQRASASVAATRTGGDPGATSDELDRIERELRNDSQ